MRERISHARIIQEERYKGMPILTNSELEGSALEKYCRIGEAGHAFLKQAVESLGLSARAYTRVLRIARTIADLEAVEDISVEHLAEAINYRTMDRQG